MAFQPPTRTNPAPPCHHPCHVAFHSPHSSRKHWRSQMHWISCSQATHASGARVKRLNTWMPAESDFKLLRQGDITNSTWNGVSCWTAFQYMTRRGHWVINFLAVPMTYISVCYVQQHIWGSCSNTEHPPAARWDDFILTSKGRLKPFSRR